MMAPRVRLVYIHVYGFPGGVIVNVDGYLMTHQKIKYTSPADNHL